MSSFQCTLKYVLDKNRPSCYETITILKISSMTSRQEASRTKDLDINYSIHVVENTINKIHAYRS